MVTKLLEPSQLVTRDVMYRVPCGHCGNDQSSQHTELPDRGQSLAQVENLQADKEKSELLRQMVLGQPSANVGKPINKASTLV